VKLRSFATESAYRIWRKSTGVLRLLQPHRGRR
jgi:hypothetical protein